MQKKELINLTNELYRLTLLFPKKEPLRYKIREVADDILVDILGRGNAGKSIHPEKTYRGLTSVSAVRDAGLDEKLEILDAFFEVAKAQNWLKYDDILNLQEEYSKLKGNLETEIRKPEPKPTEVRPLQNSLNKRQERILTFIRENERAQVWQVKQIFPQVSKRTLRRDFEQLLGKHIIRRIGEKNATFYVLSYPGRGRKQGRTSLGQVI